MAVLTNFANDCGMSVGQARYLVSLCRVAKLAEEKWISEWDPDGKLGLDADQTGIKVERYAARFGLKTTWPGLWPVFQKAGRDIYLPG